MTARYTELRGEAAFRDGLDEVVALAEREIRVFEHDLTRMALDDTHRLDRLAGFLRRSPLARLRIVVHDPDPADTRMPRLRRFLERYGHAVEIRQSPDDLRHLADAHLLADAIHGVRRFHIAHARSALVINDSTYVTPWWQRFEELWELSSPCLSPQRTGL